MAKLIAFLLSVVVLAGCSIPNRDDCEAYGIETRSGRNTPYVTPDSVEYVPLSRRELDTVCGDHTWDCGRRATTPEGKVVYRVYYYGKSEWVKNHARCHVLYGPRHSGPRELFGN